uniref:Uncharacterized protein n=1 Tax=Oryza barthii TaxID=65489 RepID=A0A0D3FNH8_9ORYZ
MSGEILVASVDDKSGTPLKCSKSTLFSLNSQVLLSQVSSLPRLQAVAEDGGSVERRPVPSRPLSTTAVRGRSSGGGARQMRRRSWAKPRALAPLPLLGSPDLAADGDGGLVSLPLRWGARRLVGKEATTAAGRRALPLAPQCGLPTSRVLFFRPRTGGKHWTQLYFGGPGSKRGPTWEGEAERHTSPL